MKKSVKSLIKFFDKLEDDTRGKLSKHPIPYSIFGGTLVVLFWRAVWDTADILYALGGVWWYVFHPVTQLIASTVILMVTGLIVSVFVGDRIILSGIKREKKIIEKTEAEIKAEEGVVGDIKSKVDNLEKKIDIIIASQNKQ